MDRPPLTARPNSSSLSSFLAAHFPTRIAETLFRLRAESARSHIHRGSNAGAQRVRAFGAPRAIALLGTFGAAALSSIPASASDGVIEINQTCAIQTGCFAGDTAGLPVTISESGSYRLTSNLVVSNENTDGIVVSIEDVGIDLNNFSIRGPVVCSGTPLACAPASGTGSGVEVLSNALSGISVRNGSIRGMGSHGVFLGHQAEVTNVRARSNRLDGINTNTASIISGNAAYQNGSRGIFASTGSIVSGNTANQNGNHGILASSGGFVSGNTVRLNTGYGLNLGVESGYRENVITGNTAGTVNGTSIVNLGNNACNGSTVCP